MKNRRFFVAMAVLILTVTTFSVYGGIFDYPFVFDDVRQILEKPQNRSLSNFFSLKGILKSRGIVNLTFAVNYVLGGTEVFGYHLFNVLIHILNGIVVFFLARLILGSITRQNGADYSQSGANIFFTSFFAALLFVVHPLQTQAVTYTVQRYTSMAALFYMASILFYLKARFLQQGFVTITATPAATEGGKTTEKGMEASGGRSGEKKKKKKGKKGKDQTAAKEKAAAGQGPPAGQKPVLEETTPYPDEGKKGPFLVSLFFILSALCALVAFRCKENTLSLPLAILLAEYFAVDRSWAGWRKKIFWIVPTVAAGALFYLYAGGLFRPGFTLERLLSDIDRATRETDQVGRLGYLFTQFNVLVVYLRLLVFPVNQNLDYMYPFNTGFFEGTTPFAFAFLLALAVFAFWSKKRWSILSFGIFWFFITLSVESSIIPIRDALFEHRMYLPLFGCALAFSWSIFHLCRKHRKLAIVICAVLAVAYGTASFARNKVWQDEYTLWTDVVSKNPRSVRGYNYLGTLEMEKGRHDTAEALLRRALAVGVAEGDAITHYNLANILKKKGDGDGAERHYRDAVRLNPRYGEAFTNLGNLYRDRGDWAAARDLYKQAVKIRPSSRGARYGLAAIHVREGNYREAAKQFEMLVKADPGDVVTRNNLAGAWIEMGENEAALRELEEIIRLRPGYGDAHFNLAALLEKTGDSGRALAHYVSAAEHGDGLKPLASFRAARIHAVNNENEQALFQLGRAFASGFGDWGAVERDGVFDALRSSDQYSRLRQKYGNGAGKNKGLLK